MAKPSAAVNGSASKPKATPKAKAAATPQKPTTATKAAPKAAAKPSTLSQEHVEDSDSESESSTDSDSDSESSAEEAKPAPTPKPAAKATPVKATPAKATPAKAASKAKPAPVTPAAEESEDSSSEDSDSDSDSESEESSAPVTPSATVMNGVKRKAEAEEKSESSKKVKVSSPESSDDSSSEEEESAEAEKEEEEEDSDDSDDEESAGEPMEGVVSTQPQPAATNGRSSTHTAVPAAPYRPPPGYTALNSTAAPAALSADALAGKQLWHIIAPAGVPLSSLKSVTRAAIRSHAPVLTHENASYALHEDPSLSSSTHVLLPSATGYTPSKVAISTTLRLQPHISLPALSSKQADTLRAGSAAAADVGLAAVEKTRSQPKGLRMRYRPPGFGKGDAGTVGLDLKEEEEADNVFQFPKVLGAHSVNNKEKGKEEKNEGEKLSKEEKARRKEAKRLKKEAKLKAKAEA